MDPDEKAEIVLAGLPGDRPVRDVCREHEITECVFAADKLRSLRDTSQAACNSTTATPRP